MEFAKEKYNFYKDIYEDEIVRSKYYDKMIQFPTSLLIVLISGFLFFVNAYFESKNPCTVELYDVFVYVLIGLFGLCCLILLFFLSRAFHGFTRAYEYLPSPTNLQIREREYYKCNYIFSSKRDFKEKRKDAIQETFYSVQNEVMEYYITMAQHNQLINDNRANMLYITRIFLLIDLVIFVVFGIVLI